MTTRKLRGTDRSMYWRLTESRVAEPCSEQDWCDWFDASLKERTVAQSRVGDVLITTVFKGLDANATPSGPPLVYETVMSHAAEPEYGHDCNGVEVRGHFSTWAEAETGHIAMCALVAEEVDESEAAVARALKKAITGTRDD